jgi:hypothetical protein
MLVLYQGLLGLVNTQTSDVCIRWRLQIASTTLQWLINHIQINRCPNWETGPVPIIRHT